MSMRQILFRGKRTSNEQWVEGSLLVYADGDCFICCEDVEPDVLNKYEVDPATVGQYTNECDIDENRIFDGDILLDTATGDHYEVIWLSASWMVHGGILSSDFLSYYSDRCKVVGNKFDDLGLLQG